MFLIQWNWRTWIIAMLFWLWNKKVLLGLCSNRENILFSFLIQWNWRLYHGFDVALTISEKSVGIAFKSWIRHIFNPMKLKSLSPLDVSLTMKWRDSVEIVFKCWKCINFVRNLMKLKIYWVLDLFFWL